MIRRSQSRRSASLTEHYRSDAAKVYRKKYGTARWKRLKARRLAEEPTCRVCRLAGRVTEATIVDHIKPHRGDDALFFDYENTQSLCSTCHSGAKQSAEHSNRGYHKMVDVNGNPVDPNHPINREKP